MTLGPAALIAGLVATTGTEMVGVEGTTLAVVEVADVEMSPSVLPDTVLLNCVLAEPADCGVFRNKIP